MNNREREAGHGRNDKYVVQIRVKVKAQCFVLDEELYSIDVCRTRTPGTSILSLVTS